MMEEIDHDKQHVDMCPTCVTVPLLKSAFDFHLFCPECGFQPPIEPGESENDN